MPLLLNAPNDIGTQVNNSTYIFTAKRVFESCGKIKSLLTGSNTAKEILLVCLYLSMIDYVCQTLVTHTI